MNYFWKKASTGDIAVFALTPNLKELCLQELGEIEGKKYLNCNVAWREKKSDVLIYLGDIAVFSKTPNLKDLRLSGRFYCNGVTGRFLTELPSPYPLCRNILPGDIKVFQHTPNATIIEFRNTKVAGNECRCLPSSESIFRKLHLFLGDIAVLANTLNLKELRLSDSEIVGESFVVLTSSDHWAFWKSYNQAIFPFSRTCQILNFWKWHGWRASLVYLGTFRIVGIQGFSSLMFHRRHCSLCEHTKPYELANCRDWCRR